MPITLQSNDQNDLVLLSMVDAWEMSRDRPSPSALRSWLKRIGAPLMIVGRETFIKRSDFIDILKRESVK